MYYKTQFKTLILLFSCILINITIYFKKINKNVQMKWKKEFESYPITWVWDTKILGSFLLYKYPNVYVYLQKNKIVLVFTNYSD